MKHGKLLFGLVKQQTDDDRRIFAPQISVIIDLFLQKWLGTKPPLSPMPISNAKSTTSQ